MDCEPDDVSCLLQVLIEQGNQQPSTLEIVSSIVVPLVLGLATMVLGIASWRIAQQSHRLNVRLSENAEADAIAEMRRATARSLLNWTRARWAIGLKQRMRYDEDRYALSRIALTAGIVKNPDPFLILLTQDLSSLDALMISSPVDSRDREQAAEIFATATAMIELWLSNPAAYVGVRGHVTKAVDSFNASQKGE